jgi:prepilin-type N-terminal cleavage/methylation domain-containing protein
MPRLAHQTAHREPCHPEVSRGVRPQVQAEVTADVSADLDVTGCTPHSAFRAPHSALLRRGLTLVEMLIATAITLIMMAAIVTLFANLSGSISNRRAMIELSGQLRQVRQQLARDLAGCTVPMTPQGIVPWGQRTGEAIGYFEIQEGRPGAGVNFTDQYPSILVDGVNDPSPNVQNFEIDYQSSLVPSGGDPRTLLPGQVGSPRDGNPNLRENHVTNGGGLGDADDTLALTVRSLGAPFVAHVRVPLDPLDIDNDQDLEFEDQRIESEYAEVIWYTTQVPQDNPDTPQDERMVAGVRGEPGMRTLYRRVLLIAPWLPVTQATGNYGAYSYEGKISTHRIMVLDPVLNGWVNKRVPNTLADLTRREYRFAHEYDIQLNPQNVPEDPTYNFPHELDIQDLQGELYDRQFAVLDNTLAFDLRVLDSGAPIYQIDAGTTVEPADPGWRAVAANASSIPASFGAYVDLGWGYDLASGNLRYTPNATYPQPQYNVPHMLQWHPRTPANFIGYPAVYDTWTWHYENDGRDQDGDFVLNASGQTVDLDADGYPDPLVDEGTNGIDDDNPDGSLGWSGVDDVMERETSPPYPVPLRAVRVILRVYERDARQAREVSVTTSFIP